MMQAIDGIYQNGHIRLLETPEAIRRMRVVVALTSKLNRRHSRRVLQRQDDWVSH